MRAGIEIEKVTGKDLAVWNLKFNTVQKQRDPNIDPKILRVLVIGTPKRVPLFLEALEILIFSALALTPEKSNSSFGFQA